MKTFVIVLAIIFINCCQTIDSKSTNKIKPSRMIFEQNGNSIIPGTDEIIYLKRSPFSIRIEVDNDTNYMYLCNVNKGDILFNKVRSNYRFTYQNDLAARFYAISPNKENLIVIDDKSNSWGWRILFYNKNLINQYVDIVDKNGIRYITKNIASFISSNPNDTSVLSFDENRTLYFTFLEVYLDKSDNNNWVYDVRGKIAYKVVF
jgi:hypothetical protein